MVLFRKRCKDVFRTKRGKWNSLLFGSRMYQDESVTVDGKNYYCKSSGEAVELSKNGWNLVDGNYLYVKDGQVLTDCVEKNRRCLLLFWLFRSYAF
mgnify:CR=1 FL=1